MIEHVEEGRATCPSCGATATVTITMAVTDISKALKVMAYCLDDSSTSVNTFPLATLNCFACHVAVKGFVLNGWVDAFGGRHDTTFLATFENWNAGKEAA
jgi:hypothetical protein